MTNGKNMDLLVFITSLAGVIKGIAAAFCRHSTTTILKNNNIYFTKQLVMTVAHCLRQFTITWRLSC
ncbi:hypothetical protein AFE_1805 [Acidithiobacillus ferrooxidans ATCC 23270]|uniref:Uncharacterized protein n=1 Tax=Acidithiobacillus ferrooxidans (strain ATCC 23270 / DSM 14882 / CIP 104768 / NCIMB 8455) TaxID=243159 RepID=B7JBR1_ACIF2|nr:hypothetical protein AFE_1805 [Acidithiobacillus ferrooxidans ATCC 23270]